MSPEGWSAIANWVMALAAVAAAVSAIIGLRSWQDQAKWNTDSELAKALLVLLFRHQDALRMVRNPAILSNETDTATKGKESPSNPNEIRFFERASVYEARWQKILDVRAEIYPLLIEGQALWGHDFRDLFSKIWALQIELMLVVHDYIQSANPTLENEERRTYTKLLHKKRDILYLTNENEDEFVADYRKSLEPIEDYLRTKLGRRK